MNNELYIENVVMLETALVINPAWILNHLLVEDDIEGVHQDESSLAVQYNSKYFAHTMRADGTSVIYPREDHDHITEYRELMPNKLNLNNYIVKTSELYQKV